MKYDVIKSTDQLMGIWGLGKVEEKGSDTKMIPHTKHSTPPAPVTASEGRQYHDVEGNPVTLNWLVRHEPDWAVNQIRSRDSLEVQLRGSTSTIAKLTAELAEAKVALNGRTVSCVCGGAAVRKQ